LERAAGLFEDLYAFPLTEAAVVQAYMEIAQQVAHFDESGLRVAGKLDWVHVARTETLTAYDLQAQRGSDALDAIIILPNFTGTAVHDGLPSYFQYTEATPGLCDAHPLRELKFIAEQYRQE
jgi:transposase